ncbi:MAG: threonine--tRNA ligase, partial [Clostridia bacterium]|nr:threonine--tRNA ligase [Clostridia bacterium]
LIEETKGRFPTWVAPVQAKVLLVSEKASGYAHKVCDMLDKAHVRFELDDRNEKIGYMIRQAQFTERIPYMVIIGDKELEENNVSVRTQDSKTVTMTAEEFVSHIRQVIDNKE